jgi:23S rRNA pseudouridine1911/1915/1917 synthase
MGNLTERERRPRVLETTTEWLALDKPAGWLTIPPSSPDSFPVLSRWLREQGVFGPAYVVHRLDRETSGVIVFARTPEAHRLAGSWFEKKEVRKRYALLAAGLPRTPVFRLDAAIGGRPAATQVEVKEVFRRAGAFYGEAVPRGGRRHQIRKHLSLRGHPLLGDRQYGGPVELRLGGEPLRVERLALHALRVDLPDGSRFEAPLPEDFSGWLESLRSGGGAPS